MNDYFGKIFCINLKDRVDRWENALGEFDAHNLIVERVDAVDGRRAPSQAGPNDNEQIGYGARGCSLSHAKILQKMIDENIPRALILEDDVEFREDVQAYFNARIRFIPANWEMLYLGGNHIGNLVMHNGPIYKTDKTYTTGSYAITLEFAKIAINNILELAVPVDVAYARMMQNHRVYTFHPGIAWQKPGHSDIENTYIDYDGYLKKKNT